MRLYGWNTLLILREFAHGELSRPCVESSSAVIARSSKTIVSDLALRIASYLRKLQESIAEYVENEDTASSKRSKH